MQKENNTYIDKDIKISSDDIKDGITPKLLKQLIARAQKNNSRYQKLIDYYEGKHDVLEREKLSKSVANNKLVCNNAKYIIDMSTAFFIGVPVDYSASEECDIELVKNAYFEQGIAGLDINLAKKAGICGRAYEMIFSNIESKPRSCMLDPMNCFIVYDDTVEHNKLLGVYYYNHYKPNGSKGAAEVIVIDKNNKYTFKGSGTGFSDLILDKTEKHAFGDVPMIEYKNTDEVQGDFEQVISLIDAYNILMSDRINDKEQFVDAILFLVNVTLDTENAKKLREQRILEALQNGNETVKAEYLYKSLTESDVEVLRKALKEDIQQYSMVPNLSDENFAGNLSGVALEYKILGFQQHVKNKEPLFARGLRDRFELYNNFFAAKEIMPKIPSHRIEISFNRNLPSNNLEIAQMISYLKGIVSDETLIAELPFVADAKEEHELMLKQQEEESNQRVDEEKRYMSATSYNKTEKDLDNELE